MKARWMWVVTATVLLAPGALVACGDSGSSSGSGNSGNNGSGNSGNGASGVAAALRAERDADSAAIRKIYKATRGTGACYETAAGQYQQAADQYNTWINGAVFRLKAGSAITDVDLRSESLREAAKYSTLLRKNADKVSQMSNFGLGDAGAGLSSRDHAVFERARVVLCPFLKTLAKAAIEEAIAVLVGKGLNALLGDSNRADDGQKRELAARLQSARWPELARALAAR